MKRALAVSLLAAASAALIIGFGAHRADVNATLASEARGEVTPHGLDPGSVPHHLPDAPRGAVSSAMEAAPPDFFAFVNDAKKAAFNGDPASQLAIIRALQACQVVAHTASSPPHPPPTSPDWKVALYDKERARCERLRTTDPFADLPRRPGGYSDAYWIDRADASGVPLAQAIRAMGLASTLGASGEGADPEKVAAVVSRLKTAAHGGDPAAYLYIGMTFGFAGSGKSFDPRQAAWLMLACRQNENCEDPSFSILDIPCPQGLATSCGFREALTNLLQTSLPPGQYARAEALSHEIEQSIQDERWDDIDLTLRR